MRLGLRCKSITMQRFINGIGSTRPIAASAIGPRSWIFPARAVDGTAAPRMPGVDDRAELSAAQVGVVHLIEHERRLPVIDQPEDGGRGDVRGDLRARRQMPAESEHRRLPATARRRQQRKARRVREVQIDMRVQDPQRDCHLLVRLHVDVLADDIDRECERVKLRIDTGRRFDGLVCIAWCITAFSAAASSPGRSFVDFSYFLRRVRMSSIAVARSAACSEPNAML